jgi:hypothetical protein
MSPERDSFPPDLDEIARLLEARREHLTALDLDTIKRRVLHASSQARTPVKGRIMRSRLTIVALIAGGALMSGGGAALGITALSDSPSASIAQYGTTGTSTQTTTGAIVSVAGAPPPAAPQNVGGVSTTSTPTPTTAGSGETTPSAPVEEGTSTGTTPPAAQVTRQVAAESGAELPFTGYAAIPVLLLGIFSLGAGLVLRRRVRRDTPES